MEALDLAAGLGVIRARVPVGDSQRIELDLDRAPTTPRRRVNTAPLSLRSEAGKPWAATARWKLATTSAALVVARASDATRNRE